MSDNVITPKDLAERCNTDPKTMRRFMRSLTDQRANKGGRWVLTSDVADEIVRRFAERHTSGAVKMQITK
jgi:hypothetical protein